MASIANLLDGEPAIEIGRQHSLTRLFGATLVREGMGAALAAFDDRRSDTEHWAFGPQGMNRLGYDLLANHRAALAVEVFQLNVLLHPEHAGLFDSLGEGYAAVGRTAEAIAAYGRSLALDPENPGGREQLRKLGADAP